MPEPLRILQLITELEPGGAERIVYELAKGLPRERFAVRVCSLRPASGAVAGWLREAGVPVHSLEMCCKWDASAIFRLARLLRSEKIQVLHSHLFHATFLARLAAGPGLRRVNTVHIPERRRRPWRFWLERWTLGRNERVVCVSEAVRRFMREQARLPEKQMRVIYDGVDLQRFAAANDAEYRCAAAEKVRRTLGLPADALVALAAGRLRAQKGFLDLVEAWALFLKAAAPAAARAQLLIAGAGPERPVLEARIAALQLSSRVRLLGQRDDLSELMAGADVFVLSSHYEGFGLVLVEAMASGLPVLATAVDSVPEVLGTADSGDADDAGSAGVLVPARDPEALGKSLAELLNTPAETRARMGSAGRARAQKFSLGAMLSAHDALYSEL